MYSVSFLSKLIWTGGKRPLMVEDLGKCSTDLSAKYLYDQFEIQWEKELKKPEKKRSFFSAVFRSTGICKWITANVLNIIAICLSFVPTIILELLVKDLESENPSRN